MQWRLVGFVVCASKREPQEGERGQGAGREQPGDAKGMKDFTGVNGSEGLLTTVKEASVLMEVVLL